MFLKERKTIIWASVGCGNVCEVKSLPAMYKLEGSQVAGVFSRNQSKAADFVKRHSLSKVYSTVDELLADEDVDIVYIATPPGSHLEYALAALDAGKHVYVEKPMALNYSECLKMTRAAEAKGLKIFVAHYRRALPYFQLVKNMIEQGRIGKVLHVDMKLFHSPQATDTKPDLHWRLKPEVSGGGYFFDHAPHGIDIIQYLLQEVVVDAHGKSSNQGGLYAAEDTVVGTLQTEGGTQIQASWCYVVPAEIRTDELVFTGKEGQIRCSVFDFIPIELLQGGTAEKYQVQNPPQIQAPFIQTILNELRGEGNCLCNAQDALPTAWAMDKLVNRI